MINVDDIEKIFRIANEYDFSHFEFKHGKSKIIIDRNNSPKTKRNASFKDETKISEAEKDENIDGEIADFKLEITEKEYIKAALPGTVYLAKEQEEEAFVKIHDDVQCDTVVGLIESMKLFNEVEAQVSGTIIDILVKNGEFVEYGTPLFEVKLKN